MIKLREYLVMTIVIRLSSSEICLWSSWSTPENECDWLNNRCVEAEVRSCLSTPKYCSCEHLKGVKAKDSPSESCSSKNKCPNFGNWKEWDRWDRLNKTYCVRQRSCNVGNAFSYSSKLCLPSDSYVQYKKVNSEEACSTNYSLLNPITGAVVGTLALIFVSVFLVKKCRNGGFQSFRNCAIFSKLRRRMNQRNRPQLERRNRSSPSISLSSIEQSSPAQPPSYNETVNSVSNLDNLPPNKEENSDLPPAYEEVMATPCHFNMPDNTPTQVDSDQTY